MLIYLLLYPQNFVIDDCILAQKKNRFLLVNLKKSQIYEIYSYKYIYIIKYFNLALIYCSTGCVETLNLLRTILNTKYKSFNLGNLLLVLFIFIIINKKV